MDDKEYAALSAIHIEMPAPDDEKLSGTTSTTAALNDPDNLSYGRSGLAGLLSQPYVFGAAFLASLGGFGFGYDQGVISLILTMDQFHAQFPETKPDHPFQGFYTGFMTAMLELGAFLGCLAYPCFAAVWFCVGAVIQTAAQDYGMLVAGRTIGRVGVGTLALGAPLYISEVAPPNLRGSLLVLESLSIVVGAIVAYWLTFGTKEMSGDWSWRLPFLLQMFPALCVGLGIHLFPFSPRWLCMRDRSEDALGSLSKLRRLPGDDHRVQLEWRGIMTEVRVQQEMARRRHGSRNGLGLEIAQWMDLFKPRYWRRTLVASAIPFFQQFSGINAFVYYAPTLLGALGQSKSMSLILSGMINIGQLVGNCITLAKLDTIGRRPLSIYGAIAMGVPHAILAGLVGTFNASWSSNPGPAWFAVALVYVYVIMYGTTYGPLGWSLPAEVHPNSSRAKGVGLAVSVNWASNFIIGVAVPPMIQGIGFGTYIFFAAWCFIAAIFSWFFVPETAGLTLEQIDGLFKDNTGAEEAMVRQEVEQEFVLDREKT